MAVRRSAGGYCFVFQPRHPHRNRCQYTQPAPSTTKPFNWQQQWYPVAIIDDLDPTKPHPTTLLNKNLVLWYDGTTWNAFLDRCPHRLAALSEGRVEDNKLQCAYHGYEFASSGACVRVPNAADAKSHANALASPRACVESFPTRQARGLLWVWGDSATLELAAATDLVMDDFAEEYVPVGPVLDTMEPFARTVPCMRGVLSSVVFCIYIHLCPHFLIR